LLDLNLSAHRSFTARDSYSESLLGLLWQIVPSSSEGYLCTHCECVEPGAGIPGVGRADLLGNVSVQVVKHKANVAIDVPVQARGVDCLPPTRNAALLMPYQTRSFTDQRDWRWRHRQPYLSDASFTKVATSLSPSVHYASRCVGTGTFISQLNENRKAVTAHTQNPQLLILGPRH
jgi:hypothetical protein